MPRDIPEEDEAVALCVDCGSVQIEAIAMKDPFLKEGKNGVCHMCGGVVIVVEFKDVEGIMRQRKEGKTY